MKKLWIGLGVFALLVFIAGGSCISRYNGMVMSETLGVYVPKGSITLVSWVQAAIVDTITHILVDGVVVAKASTGGDSAAGLKVFSANFDAGIMSIRNAATGLTTTNMQISVHYKRRA